MRRFRIAFIGCALLTASTSWANFSATSGESISITSGESLVLMGSFTLTGGSIFSAGGGQIQVGGDWDTTGGIFLPGTSTVTFSGATGSTSTLLGNTTFYHFNSVIPSKTLIFEAGSTTTVQGVFTLQGSAGQLIRVRSTLPGTQAYLVNSGSNTVSYTNPQDNNANGGNPIAAGATSTDGGNTANWFFVPLTSATPKSPGGILSTVSGSSMTVSWNAVTLSVVNTSVIISSYAVNCSTAIGATPVFNSVVTSTVTSVNVSPVNSPDTYFCRVTAYPLAGLASAQTDYVDSTADQNRISVDPSDTTGITRLVIPRAMALELRSQDNGDDDYYLEWTANTAVSPVLLDRTVTAKRFSDDSTISYFAFSQELATIYMNYVGGVTDFAVLYRNAFNILSPLTNSTVANAAPFNATIRYLGTYQIRTLQAEQGFRLVEGSPYPRVVTPNGGENRKLFIYFDNPSGSQVSGKIYDIRGAFVRNLVAGSNSPTANSMVWDARSEEGSIVPTGVYIYKITNGALAITGTIVIIR